MNDSLTKTEQDFDPLIARGLPKKGLQSAAERRGPSDWLKAAVEEIAALVQLESNWDSYGADAPRRELLQSAIDLLFWLVSSGVTLKPYVYPSRSGGVQFEWERGSRYFEVEVVSKFAATYFYSDSLVLDMQSGEIFAGEALDHLSAFIKKVEAAEA